ncbi:MAG: hypothetical protein ABSE51_01315 [Terracidiphilus sp.]|jgi:hypothetical protein
MQSYRLFFFASTLLAVSRALFSVPALAATPFAITATNVSMASTGEVTTGAGGVTSIALGSSQFIVTGIPAAGTVTISCQYSGSVTMAKIPTFCGTVGAPGIPVQAGETTFTGAVEFVPCGLTIPSLGKLRGVPHPSSHLPATGLVLAGALMLGFGIQRRAPRWLALSLFSVGALASLTAISACGGSGNGMTPGTYQYMISAGFNETGTAAIQSASTNINLTIVP